MTPTPRLSAGQFFGRVVRRQAVAGLTLSDVRYAPGTHVPRHCHEHAYFCLVRRGGYREDYGGRRRSVGPLTVSYHPPGEWHAEQIGPAEVWSFNVDVAPGWAGPGGPPLDRPFDARGGPAVGLAVRLYGEFTRPDAASPLVIAGLALELLGLGARAALPPAAGGPPAWLTRARDRLADCPAVPPLADLAAEAGVHPGHLAAAFRRHFGCAPGEFARRQRVLRACQDLTAGDAPLAEIALRAGFADQSHFTREFRRHVGVTPAAFRRAGRSKT
jgi:AraC family transcriptional regulator